MRGHILLLYLLAGLVSVTETCKLSAMARSDETSTTRGKGKNRSSPSRNRKAGEPKYGNRDDGTITRKVNWYDIVLQTRLPCPSITPFMQGRGQLMTAAALLLPFHVQ